MAKHVSHFSIVDTSDEDLKKLCPRVKIRCSDTHSPGAFFKFILVQTEITKLMNTETL